MRRRSRATGRAGTAPGTGEPGAHRALDPSWSPEDARTLARALGVARLEDHHWKVIMSCREEAARTGLAPGLREIERLSGFPASELQGLFPGEVASTIARIAGLLPAA